MVVVVQPEHALVGKVVRLSIDVGKVPSTVVWVDEADPALRVELSKVCLGHNDELVETEGIRVARLESRSNADLSSAVSVVDLAAASRSLRPLGAC